YLSREVASQTLDVADQRIAASHQQSNPQLHRHGQCPYRIVSSFGDIEIRRQRLLDYQTKKTFIPSAIHWQISKRHHYTSELKESVGEVVQSLSYRKSQETLSRQAGVASNYHISRAAVIFHGYFMDEPE
ncbi:MAG: hypothetical protein LBG58_15920, partial [Planctomycetaceae bacterium]|nr:hypothetical protein [Planctomycetaceae bacterium]